MGNSLQEQLLKAGLVDSGKSRKVQQEQRRKQRRARKGQATEPDRVRLEAERQRARQIERDRELNRQRQEAAARKALATQIRQLVESNRLDDWRGGIAYAFVDGKRVKQIHVSDAVRRQLADGRLAIVRLDDHYEPVAMAVAEKIAARDPERVIRHHEPESEPDGDDPYAEFKVPDDLMW
ncbi:MAG TPA: DUF2058 domain-containing protein [Sedimenticola thiotaurini]|uniref:DUF2058 domain-containing protein n=1 Tax=Sedimenticola thiotaurini TaxID=1543721 RepID=A0A831RLU1_9GAMM|nr:DUF2058 domain-containing protein [Sedimenticola thiotaurini]